MALAWVDAYLVCQAPWRTEAGAFCASFLPEGATESENLNLHSYTHTDTVLRYYVHIRLCAVAREGDDYSEVEIMISGANSSPSLKYYIADASGNCASTNGSHTIGAALSWTSAKADIDDHDTEVKKTVYTVTTTTDDVAGSLRAAMEDAVAAGTVKRIEFDIATPDYFDIGTPAITPVGAQVIAGDTSSFPVVLRKADPDTTGHLITLAARTESFLMQHVSLAPACNVPDNGSCVYITSGAQNWQFQNCTLRYTNSNLVTIYKTATGDPIQNGLFLRCMFRDSILGGDGTGMNVSGYYGGTEGQPETPVEDQAYESHNIRNIATAKCAWIRASHRNPLAQAGDPAHPELGGFASLNDIVYNPGWFAQGIGGDGLVDYRSCLIILPTSQQLDRINHLTVNIPPTQFVGAASIYVNGCKGVRLNNGQTLYDYDLWMRLDYTNYYVDESIVYDEIPAGVKRAEPLDDPFAISIETDLDALYADLITNGNVGAFLPSRLPSDAQALQDVIEGNVVANPTNASQIEWDVLT